MSLSDTRPGCCLLLPPAARQRVPGCPSASDSPAEHGSPSAVNPPVQGSLAPPCNSRSRPHLRPPLDVKHTLCAAHAAAQQPSRASARADAVVHAARAESDRLAFRYSCQHSPTGPVTTPSGSPVAVLARGRPAVPGLRRQLPSAASAQARTVSPTI